jgi:xanthine dehydrogenase iron-sulfur cluster and FAD-binding subunit A
MLFIYSLFNDAFSISDYRASNERMRMTVNNELERMWKEAVVA